MRKGMYAGRGPRSCRRSDERIREDINDNLTDDWYVDASDIEVTVNNGMVTITGRVDNREEKRRAEDIAECVSGVSDVSNQLRVERNIPITTEPEVTGTTRPERRGPDLGESGEGRKTRSAGGADTRLHEMSVVPIADAGRAGEAKRRPGSC